MVERPSEILGKYQVGDSIGHGAFGKVYRALNLQTGDFIAVKQIEKAVIQPEHLPGILRECELLRTLNHPNIVTFIDSHETDEFLFYIMEYVEGGSISKLVKKFGTFPEYLLAYYISQVLKGLQYLHSQGVIHRDIKGENVLVTKQGTVKLVDFGSCTYQAMDKMLTVVGTPFWMAPEIIEMDGSARNTACDIWSLGCTIIEMSTGFPPFWELGPMPAMFAMVNQEHPPLPQGISESLKDFLLLCFTKEIQRRPTAAQLLEHPWIAAALKKTEKIDFNLHNTPNPENVNLEATMKQLQMENENLRSTVKSLKQHMLKMMKDQKAMKTKVESLESELHAARSKHVNHQSPEIRRKTMAPGSVAVSNSAGFGVNGTYLVAGASVSPTAGASTSSERLFSPRGKPNVGGAVTKPLPIPPVANGNSAKTAAKLGTSRLDINNGQYANVGRNTPSQVPSPREEEDHAFTRLRSSSEPIPSPFMTEGRVETASKSPRGNNAIQTGSVSSPRNSTVRNRCGTCAGCLDDGLCHYHIANLALSPPPPHAYAAQPSQTRSSGTPSFITHSHPHAPSRAQPSPASYAAFAYARNANPQVTASTPNLPIPYSTGRVSPSAGPIQPFPSSAPPQVYLPSTSPPPGQQMLLSPPFTPSTPFSPPTPFIPSTPFSPPSLANLTLKPGDNCHVRSTSNTWHRAVIDELLNSKKSAIIVYKATGKREEVLLDNILTEEEGKRKKLEKEKGNTGKRKHVATIFPDNRQ